MTTALLWILMNAAIVTDWGQTRYISHHPDQFSEVNNPVLRGHPSTNAVNKWFVGSLVFHNGVMVALPKGYRPYYAGIVMGVTTYFAVSNNLIGIKFYF